MSDVIIDVSSNKVSRINLGVQGENIVEHVIFNISEWIEEYGEGVAYIYAKRKGDTEPYPVALDMDMSAKTATWDVNLTDTAAKGRGSAQLVYVVDEDEDNDFTEDEIKKTKIYSTTVQASLTVTSEENPSGYETWLEVLGGYTARVEAGKTAAETAQAGAEAAEAAALAAQTAAETAQALAESAQAAAETSEVNANISKVSAADSASSAANSATSAAGSASSAATSASNASNSASAAFRSATAAETAETNASQSAQAASASASSAADSASEAATSETNAKASEEDAEAAASAAATSETNAANSASAASSSATSASQSASAAAGSASTASTAASTATTKAGEASTSATNAANSASDASDSADEAAQSASEAAASAASLTVDSALDDTSTNPVQNKVITEELDDKANVDGYYESLGAGTADQLASNIYEEDSAPYTFRTSGGSMDIGDRETDMLVGGTVAWNQLVQNGDFADSSIWAAESGATINISGGIATVTNSGSNRGMYQRIASIVSGHKYLAKYDAWADEAMELGFSLSSVSYFKATKAITTSRATYSTIAPFTGTNDFAVLYVYPGTANVNVYIDNVMLIDLTQMFGSAIADYICSLEQAIAGAGVAYFRKLFPKPYYAYNAGELMSVQVASHDMVGFNQWDEEWELGGINQSDGQNGNANDRIRSKNYIQCVPNTSYFAKLGGSNWRVFYYDADKNFLNYVGTYNDNRIVTTPTNAHYMRFWKIGTTYKNDICINLSWDGERNGEYEPYVKHSYPLDSSLTLRGIPKLDASNNLYYDGDTYASDGTVTRKYGIIMFDGSTDEAWSYNANYDGFRIQVVDANVNEIPANQLKSNNFIGASYRGSMGAGLNTLGQILTYTASTGVDTQFLFFTTSITDLTEWQTWLSNNKIYLVYPLATPTTETAETYTNPQIVDDFGTEEYVTDSIVPVGHYTQYMANLKAKLEMSPNSPDGEGDYIVRQSNGENEYVSLASNATIQDIIARLEALEGGE